MIPAKLGRELQLIFTLFRLKILFSLCDFGKYLSRTFTNVGENIATTWRTEPHDLSFPVFISTDILVKIWIKFD